MAYTILRPPQVAAIRLRGEIPRQKVGSSRQGCDRTDERGRAETDEGGGGTRREDTWAWLVDMEGAGPGDAPAWQTLRELDEILFAHYPGRLGKVLIVNASGDWCIRDRIDCREAGIIR